MAKDTSAPKCQQGPRPAVPFDQHLHTSNKAFNNDKAGNIKHLTAGQRAFAGHKFKYRKSINTNSISQNNQHQEEPVKSS